MRRLGGGRRHEAYVAWDDVLHGLVVVKVLRPGRLGERDARAALAAEARMLRRLNHPVIVRAFGEDLDGERPHVVLELLDGPRLSTLVRRYGVIEEQLIPLALQMCSALHYMAASGVVHLDVKPQNIIMSAPPRLIDLSVARPVDTVSEMTAPVGTDAYMAPEQCDPARFAEVGPASDVWGLGATLYEAMTGARAFPGAGGSPRFPQLQEDAPPVPRRRGGSRRLAEAVAACLERDPSARPTAAEVAAEIEPAADDLPRPRLGLFRPGGRARTRRGS